MAKYTQANRPIRIKTVLGDDALLLQGFAGQEGVSTPFSYTLDLRSENASIDPAKLLKSAACISLQLADGSTRPFHGLINRFTQLERADELVAYRAQMVPWLWFLALSSDCKIFQNLSVLEIVEQVFKAQGYSDFEIKCTKSYPKREFCVQYRETHLDFVSRLMEEEGIFYFFEHTKDKHTIVLADVPTAVKPGPVAKLPVTIAAMDKPVANSIIELEVGSVVTSGKVTLFDYNDK